MEDLKIICHMTTSIDGKVTGSFLYREDMQPLIEHYYEIHRSMKVDGFMCGRVTMNSSFVHDYLPELSQYKDTIVSKEDFIAAKSNFYAISFDTFARLGWKDSVLHDDDPGYDNAHIIEIVSEQADDSMLAYYQKIGVSYLFAGKEKIDLKLALEKLQKYYGVKKLLLEGGAILNGSFAGDDLIDAYSLVVLPVISENDEDASLIQGHKNNRNLYQLKKTHTYEDDSLYLYYTRRP